MVSSSRLTTHAGSAGPMLAATFCCKSQTTSGSMMPMATFQQRGFAAAPKKPRQPKKSKNDPDQAAANSDTTKQSVDLGAAATPFDPPPVVADDASKNTIEPKETDASYDKTEEVVSEIKKPDEDDVPVSKIFGRKLKNRPTKQEFEEELLDSDLNNFTKAL